MARRARFKPWCPPGRPGSSPGWSTMQQVTVTVDVDGIPAQMSVQQWTKYYEQTGIMFTSSEQKYTIGCDPYKLGPRTMTDEYSRELMVGQVITTRHFSIGLIVSMTKGGNPRCVAYDIVEEKIKRQAHVPYDWKLKGPSKTIKIGDIPKGCAWTEGACLILRAAGDPRTELPPAIKQVEKELNPMFTI